MVGVVDANSGAPSARAPGTVSEFLRSVTQQPSGLVIEGEPGIGKTTLWLSAVEQARDSGYPGFLRTGGASGVGARQHCVERGAETDMMFVSIFDTLIHVWRGDFTNATLVAEETTERAQQLSGDHMHVIAMTLRAVVAYTGRENDARHASCRPRGCTSVRFTAAGRLVIDQPWLA